MAICRSSSVNPGYKSAILFSFIQERVLGAHCPRKTQECACGDHDSRRTNQRLVSHCDRRRLNVGRSAGARLAMREVGEAAMLTPFRCGGTHPCSKGRAAHSFRIRTRDDPKRCKHRDPRFLSSQITQKIGAMHTEATAELLTMWAGLY